MTEPREVYLPQPDPLTPEQVTALFSAIRQVGQYGRVTLTIERGRVRLMEVSQSFNLERLEVWDCAEARNK